MKTYFRISFFVFITSCFSLILPQNSSAGIDLPWSYSFTGGACEAEWQWSPSTYHPPCYPLYDRGLDGTCSGGEGAQITTAANMAAGAGGRGFRHWVGDGRNDLSGGLAITMNTLQTEFWLRWYMRYEYGFNWEYINWDKIIYIDPTTDHWVIPEWKNADQACIGKINSPMNIMGSVGTGWANTMGGPTSDGQWHLYELHLKMDTNGTNGVGQYWIDEVLVVDAHDLNLGTHAPGWEKFLIGSNKGFPLNGRCMAVDFDDIAISNTGYIGPISGGSDTIPPSVSIASPTQGQTVSGNLAISASASDNIGVAGVQFKLDGADIGAEDTTSPYSTSWDTTTVSDGSYTLTATARDAAGNRTTSSPVSVTVNNGGGQDTIPPTVSLTLPSQGQTISGTVTVSANASDNVGVAGVQFKLDGADLGAEDTTSPYSISWNTTTVSDGSYTLTATARDAVGNQTTSSPVTVTISNGAGGALLFEESFEDANFASSGWYDNTNLQLSTTEHVAGSTTSVEYHFLQGATTPTSGGSIRHKFNDTDEVYISYYVKYSSNWDGSNRAYHPHEFLIMTNENGDWDGPAYSHLTAYIEQNEGEPLLGIQDGQNIDEGNIGVDLTQITEHRAVAGCNGDSDGQGNGLCYVSGSVHWNGKQWRPGSVYFSDNPGQYYKNDWHHIEAYIKLNSISGGIGQKDGVLRYWYDGNLIIDHNDIMLRTGQHPNMKFNQFIIAPWIGDGSPVDQTFWIDDLRLRTSSPRPSPPDNLVIVQ